MKVLLCGTSLLAGYGGPAISVASLANALAQAGVDVDLWAPDQSAGAAPAVQDGRVLGLSGSLREAVERSGRPDLIHDNGLWLAHNHMLAALAARRGIPRIVSTRGMLEPWARRHKYWKKKLAWLAYQRRDLQQAQTLHATSEEEAANLGRLGLGSPVSMIPNGVDLPAAIPSRRPRHAERTALFLGRIYPVKGLPMLIEAWSLTRPAGWRLKIVGPEEAGHKAELEQLVRRRDLAREIAFGDAVGGSLKAEAMAEADLLILPSHSESFGMVVAEALAHGLPVLTTTAVPWPRLETSGCGWRVPPTVAGIAEGLRSSLSRDSAELAKMGERGRELVASEYGWSRVAAEFLDVYERLVATGPPLNQRLTRAA